MLSNSRGVKQGRKRQGLPCRILSGWGGVGQGRSGTPGVTPMHLGVWRPAFRAPAGTLCSTLQGVAWVPEFCCGWQVQSGLLHFHIRSVFSLLQNCASSGDRHLKCNCFKDPKGHSHNISNDFFFLFSHAK